MNAFDIVTRAFVSQLSLPTPVVPWHKPWRPGYHGAISRAMKKEYSPLNQMILSHSGEYIGVQAAIELKADFRGVRREEAVWASRYDRKTGEVDPETGEEKTRTCFGYKRHGVLPVALLKDRDGNPLQPLTPPVDAMDASAVTSSDIDALVSSYLSKAGLLLRTDASLRPEYDPASREVRIPPVTCFESQSAYYACLFRLLVQSTGDPHLLDRAAPATEHARVQEELTLEIGSSLLLSACCLDTDEVFNNSVAYASMWASRLTDHSSAALLASTAAEKAVNLILGLVRETHSAS